MPNNALKWYAIERHQVDKIIKCRYSKGIKTVVQIRQTKKSFPFGTAVNAGKYNRDAGHGKYRAFIHNHFNWAVPENALKWYSIERNQVTCVELYKS